MASRTSGQGERHRGAGEGDVPPYFPIGPKELRGKWSFSTIAPGAIETEGFRVEARRIPHGGNAPMATESVTRRRSSSTRLIRPSLIGPGPEDLGDYHRDALELAKQADVVVHDAQMTAEDLETTKLLGHSAVGYAVELGRKSAAGLWCSSTTSWIAATRHSTPSRSAVATSQKSSSWPSR